MTLVERLAEARTSGDYQALFDAVPYSKFLGLSARLDGSELITTMAALAKRVVVKNPDTSGEASVS